MNKGFIYRPRLSKQDVVIDLFLLLYCTATLALVAPPHGGEKIASVAVEDILFEQANMLILTNTGSVLDIIEDKSGYLWLGSSEGLFKYDGYEFKRYLGDDSYYGVFQEPGGILWSPALSRY